MIDPQHEETFADTERKLRDIITTLRAQLAEAHKDGSQLAAWQCLFEDGKTGIVCDDWGNQYCAMQRRADRAEAALAAQIEVDACDCPDPAVCQTECFATAIRNQPHDRTALDRMLTEAREKALREAAEVTAYMPGSEKHKPIMAPWRKAILALIEKPDAR